MRIAEDELDATQAPTGPCAQVQKASASEGITEMPSTSRRLWALTATATISATDTMLPPWRTAPRPGIRSACGLCGEQVPGARGTGDRRR